MHVPIRILTCTLLGTLPVFMSSFVSQSFTVLFHCVIIDVYRFPLDHLSTACCRLLFISVCLRFVCPSLFQPPYPTLIRLLVFTPLPQFCWSPPARLVRLGAPGGGSIYTLLLLPPLLDHCVFYPLSAPAPTL